jgi:3-hydroxyisobutyrate dehydrogenase
MLGLGSMGGPIAANIARRGFEVWGYDPRPEAVSALAEAGVRGAASPAEVGRNSEVTLAIPFDYGQVEQALFGADGLVEGLDGPGLFVCMSTIGPDNARELEGRLAERGHRLVDAPVSGGAAGAAAGTLTIMVGGATADVERCRPVLDAFCGNVFHVGQEAGAGQGAKLVNQLLVATHLVATSEALLLAARTGLDLSYVQKIIGTCAGNSVIFSSRAPVMIDRSFKTGGKVGILIKDARLVLEAAHSASAPLPLMASALQVLEAARAFGLANEDDAAIIKAYEALTQEPIS